MASGPSGFEGTGSGAHEPGKRQKWIAGLVAGWAVVVILYFLWETLGYRGIYARVAEWQFDQFGHYFPMFNYGLLVLLFASPVFWLARLSPRSKRRGEAIHRALATGNRFRIFLLALAGIFGAAALGTVLWTVTLPAMSAPTDHVSAGSSQAGVKTGPATLSGHILYSRTSAYSQTILLKKRGVRFAPVLATSPGNRAIQYFIELAPSDVFVEDAGDKVSTRAGVLMPNSLPGSIVLLYRYAGYDVANPYYVLYTSPKTIRWPYYLAALQLLTAALISLIAALLQHRHVKMIGDHQSAATNNLRRTGLAL